MSRADDEVKAKGNEYLTLSDDWDEDDKVLMVLGYQNI